MELPSNLQLHSCTVTVVHEDGLINAQSERNNQNFVRCLPIQTGTATPFSKGDKCLVLSDGAQQYAIGAIHFPSRNRYNQGASILQIDDEFNKLSNINALISKSSTGDPIRVMVSSGGIMMDCGGQPGVHLDPGMRKISSFSERYELNTLPGKITLEHNNNECKIDYLFRASVDKDSWIRGMEGDDKDHLAMGQTVRITISDSEDVISIEQRDDGEVKTRITFDRSGQISIYNAGDTLRSESHFGEGAIKEDYPAMAKMVHMMMGHVMDAIMDMVIVDSQGRARSFRFPHVNLYKDHNLRIRDAVLSQFTRGWNLESPYRPTYDPEKPDFPPISPVQDDQDDEYMTDSERENDTILAYVPIKLVGDESEEDTIHSEEDLD